MNKLLLFLALLLALASPARAQPEPIVVGLPSSGSADAVYDMWRPLLEDMSRELGRPVRAEIFKEYAGVVWALRRGSINLAWLGNKGAIEAVDRAKAEVGLQVINRSGTGGYYAHIIARRSLPLENVDDLVADAPNLAFGMGDPNSTSGSLVPGYYLFAARGLDPGGLFKRLTRGGHESNFLAVADGVVDAATNNSADLARLADRYPDKYKRIKIIWTSPLIPSDPILWPRDLPAPLKGQITRFLTDYGKDRGVTRAQLVHENEVLRQLSWTGFRPSDNSQLIPVRQVKLYRDLLVAKNDPALGEEQRARLVDSIERKLKDLEKPQ